MGKGLNSTGNIWRFQGVVCAYHDPTESKAYGSLESSALVLPEPGGFKELIHSTSSHLGKVVVRCLGVLGSITDALVNSRS